MIKHGFLALGALGALGALSVAAPQCVTAQSTVPSFIRQGRTYIMVVRDTEQPVTVLDMGVGPWIKVAVEAEEFWINLNQVSVIQEITSEGMAPLAIPRVEQAPAQCETFNTTDYNSEGSCFDAPPSLRVAPLVPRLADIIGNPSPATLAIKVNADGSVAMIFVTEPSNNETFTEVAIQFAQNIEYNPAQKRGQPVAGWIQQAFTCCQQQF